MRHVFIFHYSLFLPRALSRHTRHDQNIVGGLTHLNGVCNVRKITIISMSSKRREILRNIIYYQGLLTSPDFSMRSIYIEAVWTVTQGNIMDTVPLCTRKYVESSDVLMLHYKFSKLNVEFKFLKIMKILSCLLNNEISMRLSSRHAGGWR